MKKAIFITVRTGSTRLPQKALLDICGKPTIVHLIERVRRSKKADCIVLCTTTQSEDAVLCQLATDNGVLFFAGSVEDKLDRWHQACQKFGIDFFVTADGDDVFCEPELIDLAFSQHEQTGADFIEAKGLICGAFTYGISAKALKKVCDIKDSSNTEMMWVYFTDTGLFRVETLENVPSVFMRDDIRMTLDYPDDLRFFQTVFAHFLPGNPEFNLRDIVTYLDQHPDVSRINYYLQDAFLENQKAKTSLQIKKGAL